MVRMAEEIADTKRRITDVEGVLMEQFDDRALGEMNWEE